MFGMFFVAISGFCTTLNSLCRTIRKREIVVVLCLTGTAVLYDPPAEE
jgi:hypothetical protein